MTPQGPSDVTCEQLITKAKYLYENSGCVDQPLQALCLAKIAERLDVLISVIEEGRA